VTLPTSDAQSSRFPLHHPESTFPTPTHSMTPAPPLSLRQPTTPPPALTPAGPSKDMDYERTIDFATHSWDLATGGLKTLTAKRELPSLLERRPTGKLPPDTTGLPRSYTFMLIVLICLVLMLISGGVVLFVMLQP
jgi:hypothetical protein